ncbi:MBL fold metallo-hydrolase [Dethiothermospora halolimnae]|uniref:MBL fold metallo-hydrolase n=1 Tax=Dethiothermospora halolimnae TaxID=3114390 RepID=UPI003CCB916F
MIIKNIGSRGVHFIFEEGDSPLGDLGVYLIKGDNRLYLCDTQLGPRCMDVIKEYIYKEGLSKKELVIFNTHSDWDHVWGNMAFEYSDIIGHKTCKERMEEIGEYDIKKYEGKFHKGDIKIKLPNITFEDKLTYEDDGVEFIYTPGHTICSAICFDKKDLVAFIGDMVEEPFPILQYHDLERYIESLKFIKNLPAKTFLSAHSGEVDRETIDENIEYIKGAMVDNKGELGERYEHNVKLVLVSEYEDKIKGKLGNKYNYETSKGDFLKRLATKCNYQEAEGNIIGKTSYNELKKAYKEYIEGL